MTLACIIIFCILLLISFISFIFNASSPLIKQAQPRPVESLSQQQRFQDHSHLMSEDMQNWLAQQKKFKERIKTVCEKYGTSLQVQGNAVNFMLEPKHQILFCKNAKVLVIRPCSLFLIVFIMINSQSLIEEIMSSFTFYLTFPRSFCLKPCKTFIRLEPLHGSNISSPFLIFLMT